MKTEDKAAEVTLQDCKDKVAEKCGYTSWGAFVSCEIKNYATTSFWKFLDEAAELYASQVSASKDREIEELNNELKMSFKVRNDMAIEANGHYANYRKEINELKSTISDQSKTIEELKKAAHIIIDGSNPHNKVDRAEFRKAYLTILNS